MDTPAILYVEDDPETSELYSIVLSSMGRVDVASDSLEGMAKYAQGITKTALNRFTAVVEEDEAQKQRDMFEAVPSGYALIITDNNMRRTNEGLDFLRILREMGASLPQRLMVASPTYRGMDARALHERVRSLDGVGLYEKGTFSPQELRVVAQELVYNGGNSETLNRYFARRGWNQPTV